MKTTVRLLVRFLIWFVTIVIVAGALITARGYVTGFDPVRTADLGALMPLLLPGLARAWVPAALLSGLLSLFAAARLDRVSGPTIPVLFALWTLTLIAGGFVLSFVPPEIAGSPVLPTGRIARVDAYRLYPLGRIGIDAVPLVLHDEREQPAFQVRVGRHADRAGGELEIPGDPRSPIDLERLANSYPSMVQPPAQTAGLRADVAEVAHLLALDEPDALPTILNLVALAFFVLGCWTVVRLTRWPLFNAALALACIRFALWIVPASRTGSLRPFLVAAFDSTVLPVASAIILAAAGLGLLALLVFLPPFAEWRREIHHD